MPSDLVARLCVALRDDKILLRAFWKDGFFFAALQNAEAYQRYSDILYLKPTGQ